MNNNHPISAKICFNRFSPLTVHNFKDTAVNIEYRILDSIVQCLYKANNRLKNMTINFNIFNKENILFRSLYSFSDSILEFLESFEELEIDCDIQLKPLSLTADSQIRPI